MIMMKFHVIMIYKILHKARNSIIHKEKKEARSDFGIIKPEERNQLSVYFNSVISSQISINFFKLLALRFSKLYL
ncbi:MAG: hypothetical protein Lokiarch_11790 [Candidatus Lokiarchaeum sp. GC14_75]|nr:MAG: hypothetical protein Lokiarch_11790 [Candidatus Lokiarchaeum sp. GC14_75]